ncbi:hypothetical protein [Borreliella valaisiana]|uniref:Uncharacterized protein n=1 Tax=Borreliella valaisiana VS116 TaxID=445987 RepID=C0R927_BORVA|nr:hypothetical protein [Borreliella valaisiana]ACN53060.1 conserved hypothetical protein [Borreliella valaisiana VS116]
MQIILLYLNETKTNDIDSSDRKYLIEHVNKEYKDLITIKLQRIKSEYYNIVSKFKLFSIFI